MSFPQDSPSTLLHTFWAVKTTSIKQYARRLLQCLFVPRERVILFSIANIIATIKVEISVRP